MTHATTWMNTENAMLSETKPVTRRWVLHDSTWLKCSRDKSTNRKQICGCQEGRNGEMGGTATGSFEGRVMEIFWNYTLVMTFYNLWWEGDGTLDSVLETKRKTRRREGNRMLIMFWKNAYGTCQHYRNLISLILIIALLVPQLRRGNWRNELSK